MGITAVNLAAFRDLQRRVDALASNRLADALSKRMGAAAIKELADQFRESRDPYGDQWAPVNRTRGRDRRAKKKNARPDKPLIDTGRLRAAAVSQQANQSGAGVVRVVIPVAYASYHQEGTSRIRRRQMLPSADRGGLGPRWTAAFNQEAARLLREHFGK